MKRRCPDVSGEMYDVVEKRIKVDRNIFEIIKEIMEDVEFAEEILTQGQLKGFGYEINIFTYTNKIEVLIEEYCNENGKIEKCIEKTYVIEPK